MLRLSVNKGLELTKRIYCSINTYNATIYNSLYYIFKLLSVLFVVETDYLYFYSNNECHNRNK